MSLELTAFRLYALFWVFDCVWGMISVVMGARQVATRWAVGWRIEPVSNGPVFRNFGKRFYQLVIIFVKDPIAVVLAVGIFRHRRGQP
jgi:hypothetical protein